jgi:hypothetical protein
VETWSIGRSASERREGTGGDGRAAPCSRQPALPPLAHSHRPLTNQKQNKKPTSSQKRARSPAGPPDPAADPPPPPPGDGGDGPPAAPPGPRPVPLKRARTAAAADADADTPPPPPPPPPPSTATALAAWGAEADALTAALASVPPLVPWPAAPPPPRPSSRPPTGSEVGPYLVGRGDPLSAVAPAICAALGGEGRSAAEEGEEEGGGGPPSDGAVGPLLTVAAVRSAIIDAAVRRALGEPLRRGERREKKEKESGDGKGWRAALLDRRSHSFFSFQKPFLHRLNRRRPFRRHEPGPPVGLGPAGRPPHPGPAAARGAAPQKGGDRRARAPGRAAGRPAGRAGSRGRGRVQRPPERQGV